MGQAGPFSWGKFLGRGPAVNCRGHRPEGGAGALRPAPRSPPPRAPSALSLGATGFAWGPGWLLSRGALQGKPVGWGAARFGVRPDRVISLLPRPSGLPSPSPAPLLVQWLAWCLSPSDVGCPGSWAPGPFQFKADALTQLPSKSGRGSPGEQQGTPGQSVPTPTCLGDPGQLPVRVVAPWCEAPRQTGGQARLPSEGASCLVSCWEGSRPGRTPSGPQTAEPRGREPPLGRAATARPSLRVPEPRWSPCWGRGARSW